MQRNKEVKLRNLIKKKKKTGAKCKIIWKIKKLQQKQTAEANKIYR